MTQFTLTFDSGKRITVSKPESEEMLRQLYPIGSRFQFADGSVATVKAIEFLAAAAK